MTDRVRMTSLSVFQNERITVFREGGPAEGETGVPVTVGDAFETDLDHAKDLDRLKLAEPVNRADLDGEAAPLEPHYQVSVPDLLADRQVQARRAAEEKARAEEDEAERLRLEAEERARTENEERERLALQNAERQRAEAAREKAEREERDRQEAERRRAEAEERERREAQGKAAVAAASQAAKDAGAEGSEPAAEQTAAETRPRGRRGNAS